MSGQAPPGYPPPGYPPPNQGAAPPPNYPPQPTPAQYGQGGPYQQHGPPPTQYQQGSAGPATVGIPVQQQQQPPTHYPPPQQPRIDPETGKPMTKAQLAQGRKDLPNVWQSGLLGIPCKRPGYCCCAVFCSWCVSWQLRKQFYRDDLSQYVCCGGFMPCSGKCGEKGCPAFCLCMEVCCCFALSVQSTRYLIQDELRLANTKCDNCVIGTMVCLQSLACICDIIALVTSNQDIDNIAEIIRCIADCVYCSVCACMQTQHKHEMDHRDGKYAPNATQSPTTAPQQQPQFAAPYPGPPAQQGMAR